MSLHRMNPHLITRRALLASVPAFAALPRGAFAQSRLSLRGALKEGELIVGETQSGARIMLDGKLVRVSDKGSFAFGFSYDQKSPSILVALYSDGSSEKRELVPVMRMYDIQRIDGLPQN